MTSTDPGGGATLAYSGQQVVAAQALASGQVVVALANGVVDILAPQGNGLFVQSQLLNVGGTPLLPSSIEVVAKANGLFEVLVSSQGSDNLSVFSLASASASGGGIVPSPGGTPAPTFAFNNVQLPGSATTSQPTVLTASAVATSANASAAASATASASTSSGALSATATSAVGLSLGGFTSLSSGSSKGTGDALLVSVEGNTYLSVPILDFGAENDEVGESAQRDPGLSAQHAFGDTSPLTRFVSGLDEALTRLSRGGSRRVVAKSRGSRRPLERRSLLPAPANHATRSQPGKCRARGVWRRSARGTAPAASR